MYHTHLNINLHELFTSASESLYIAKMWKLVILETKSWEIRNKKCY